MLHQSPLYSGHLPTTAPTTTPSCFLFNCSLYAGYLSLGPVARHFKTHHYVRFVHNSHHRWRMNCGMNCVTIHMYKKYDYRCYCMFGFVNPVFDFFITQLNFTRIIFVMAFMNRPSL